MLILAHFYSPCFLKIHYNLLQIYVFTNLPFDFETIFPANQTQTFLLALSKAESGVPVARLCSLLIIVHSEFLHDLKTHKWLCDRNSSLRFMMKVWFLDVYKPQHFSPCSTDSRCNSAGINVICWSAFQLEVTAIEWQTARFGPAHTCPWVFSAWCWWTSTRRVKGLSYKSGTITLEVKTCTMPLTEGGRAGRGNKE